MDRKYFYDLALPPRHVPWLVRGQLLFGGFTNQFGWLWLGFSLIFVWLFGLNADLSSILFTLEAVETASGVVSAVEETNASEDEVSVYAYYYSFRVEELETAYQGVSYSTGKYFEPEQEVVVEYLKRNPSISRIENTRRAEFGPWVLGLVLIFPLIGLGFVIFGLKNGFKANRLLARGKVGLGVLTSKEATNMEVNDQTVYKLTFEFTADDGMLYEVVTKTHLPYPLEDEAEERLLYDPYHPNYAVMLDNLPGAPDIDEMGNICPAGLTPGWLALVLPTLTLVGHGTVLLLLIF
jgi:hypothetical protein